MNASDFRFMSFLRGWPQRLWWLWHKRHLGACGVDVRLPRNGSYTLNTLFLGDDIQIGGRSYLWAVHSRIRIGSHVVTGPGIAIMAGNHNTSLLGKFLIDVGNDEKRPEDDQDVVIEGDCWIGARAIILQGVTIGRGAVIGAGAVVTKSVPQYCIAVGNPARPVRWRGTVEQILRHEERLYPPDQRLAKETLAMRPGI